MSKMSSDFSGESNDRSLGHWVSILNYYDENETNLSEDEVISLYKECERCREHFNKSTKSDKCEEREVSRKLYSRGRSLVKDKYRNAVTSSHSIAR